LENIESIKFLNFGTLLSPQNTRRDITYGDENINIYPGGGQRMEKRPKKLLDFVS
jgi:hypothetical protein